MDKDLESIRVDDLPIIYMLLEQLGIREAIDQQIHPHGNWVGPSIGSLTSLWLCYILSECDHRLSMVETWAEQRLPLLQALIGEERLSSKDFADDKLASILDYLSEEADWSAIETSVNQTGIELYRLDKPNSLPTFRLDSAPMQSHGQVEPGGLLQYGYSKHHNGDLGQFKIQLCSLDNEVNHFAYPFSHISVSGEKADDGLYLPLIHSIKAQLSNQAGYEQGNLYVADGKMGSQATRATIAKGQDYYLVPLSKVQLPEERRLAYIQSVDPQTYQQIIKVEQEGQADEVKKLIASGFEKVVKRTYEWEVEKEAAEQAEAEGEAAEQQTAAARTYEWTERLLFVKSDYYATQQAQKLDKQLDRVSEQIKNLTVPKQGKKTLKEPEEVQQAVDKILKDNKLEDLLKVTIDAQQHTRAIRAYGDKPAREEISYTFEITVERQAEQIASRRQLMGWQVYATNAPSELLTFEQCVWKYRYQSNIERQFDNIRNKVVKLLPVYLMKDERIIGLVNLLMLALKACSLAEYKVAKALKEQDQALADVYEGNPKRTTKTPSAKRLFKAFDGISIALVFTGKQLEYALMTKLEPVQKKIIQLMGFDLDLYPNLVRKIQMFFSVSRLIET
ncbi:MAG: IS1634 family transposase [Bacteroidota bacterium]